MNNTNSAENQEINKQNIDLLVENVSTVITNFFEEFNSMIIEDEVSNAQLQTKDEYIPITESPIP